jgi:hypothetical protein
LTKNGLGYSLGDFFTNSSDLPAWAIFRLLGDFLTIRRVLLVWATSFKCITFDKKWAGLRFGRFWRLIIKNIR